MHPAKLFKWAVTPSQWEVSAFRWFWNNYVDWSHEC